MKKMVLISMCQDDSYVQMLSTMDYARLKKEYEGKASIPVTLGVPEGAQPDASLELPLGKAVFWSVSEASRSG